MAKGRDVDADADALALRRLDQGRSVVLGWLAAAAAVEAALLITFVLLADFSNRTHVLLLVASLLVYLTLALGLIALGAFVRWWGLRIVLAVETVKSAAGAEERGDDDA